MIVDTNQRPRRNKWKRRLKRQIKRAKMKAARRHHAEAVARRLDALSMPEFRMAMADPDA